MQKTAAVRPLGTLVIVGIGTVQSPLSPGLRLRASFLLSTARDTHAWRVTEDRQDGFESVWKEKTVGTHLLSREFEEKQRKKSKRRWKNAVDA